MNMTVNPLSTIDKRCKAISEVIKRLSIVETLVKDNADQPMVAFESTMNTLRKRGDYVNALKAAGLSEKLFSGCKYDQRDRDGNLVGHDYMVFTNLDWTPKPRCVGEDRCDCCKRLGKHETQLFAGKTADATPYPDKLTSEIAPIVAAHVAAIHNVVRFRSTEKS